MHNELLTYGNIMSTCSSETQRALSSLSRREKGILDEEIKQCIKNANVAFLSTKVCIYELHVTKHVL